VQRERETVSKTTVYQTFEGLNAKNGKKVTAGHAAVQSLVCDDIGIASTIGMK
jgi:hypothetical protein